MARRPNPSNPFIVGDSLADILAEARISLGRKSLAAGRDVKVVCPACNGGGTKEASLSVQMDPDGAGVKWHCFRGNCPGNSIVPGGGRIEGVDRVSRRGEEPVRRERRVSVKPVLHTEAEKGRPESLYGLFEKRGILRETVDEFGIYGVSRRWPKLDDDGRPVKDEEGEVVWEPKPTIVFPYRWRGEIVNRKFRSLHKQFQQDKDSQRTLFNADAITSPDVVVLVEGEFDVLACWEAGLRQVVSLPDGSPNKLLDEDDPKRADDLRFDPLENCADVLEGVEKFVIATDADVAGGYLAEEFARRLGRHRCWRVTWPEGCKDANDVLLKHGKDVLLRCVEQAEPWPLAGLFVLRPGALREFLTSGREPRGFTSGIKALDEVARLPEGGGWLTVVTGIPSHGKSAFLRAWLPYIAMKHDVGIVWCSPEDNRPEILALGIAQVIAGQPAREAGTLMPDHVLTECEDWIRRRITFVSSDDPDTDMTLEWLLDRAEQAKRRHPRQLLVLDPWNEVEHLFSKGESETQYTGRWLRKIKAWGRAEGIGALIAVHPKQQIKDPKTKKYPVVEGYDISGSANWFNRADLGLTVYREVENEVQVKCWKARFPAFGQRYLTAKLKRDARHGRLSSFAVEDDKADEPKKEIEA